MQPIKHKDKWYLKTKNGYREIIATTNPEFWVSSSNIVYAISQLDIEYIISLYNGESKEVDNLEDRKIVAAQQYALSKCKADEMGSLTKVKLAWENGFENARCLQDNADKKFTLEQVMSAVKNSYGLKYFSESKFIENLNSLTKQPKSDTVIVEYEEAYEDGNFPNNRLTPKLKDGHIVIVRN